MIDPMLSLALSVHSNKGVYALLLGSGISRSAGVPTGWEVVLDLARRVAALQQEDPEPDPAAWFQKKYGTEPDYSKLLEVLARSPTERHQLLRGYFEPTEPEREEGKKTPTPGHRAIAALVKAGHVRVIVTTNFDRLLEQALENIGIVPTVISSADQTKGAMPMQHSICTVIKIHGDYLDTRIKNTPAELETYDAALDGLLDRVFSEYGLIISGWSGEWDPALRRAIERCGNYRFSCYWTARGLLGERAKALVQLRLASVIQVESADTFFPQLREKLEALESMSERDPLSTSIAVATAKKYLAEDRFRIRLHDLIVGLTDRLLAEVRSPAFDLSTPEPDQQSIGDRARRYEALTDGLAHVLAAGVFFGTPSQDRLWVQCISRLGSLDLKGGYDAWTKMRAYPGSLLLYATGLVLVASGNFSRLNQLFDAPTRSENRDDRTAVESLNPWRVMSQDVGRLLPGQENKYTPVHNRLFEVLRPVVRDYIPDDASYDHTFDVLDYFVALACADKQGWGPIGRFGWKLHWGSEKSVLSQVAKELDSQKEQWPPLLAGMFGGSLERVVKAKAAVDDRAVKVGWW